MNKTIWFLFLTLIVFACNNDNPLKVDVKKIVVEKFKIKRFEQQLFRIPSDSFITKVGKIQKDFPVFIDGSVKDTQAILGLRTFFEDPYMIELYDLSQKQFKDLNSLENQLQESFKYFKYHFPALQIPQVYTYISGLDLNFPVKYAVDNLLIGLDLYLGDSTIAYKTSGFPAYKTAFLKQEYILRDCMSEIGVGLMPEFDKAGTLLDDLIYQGKFLYFTKAMIPDIQDTILLKYTSKQLAWINEYEAKVWSFILENKYLFEKNPGIKSKFMTDGPFTVIFAKDSPARLGDYLGYKIVSKYMENSEESLENLLLEKDNQKILKISKYKPKM